MCKYLAGIVVLGSLLLTSHAHALVSDRLLLKLAEQCEAAGGYVGIASATWFHCCGLSETYDAQAGICSAAK